MTSTNHILSHTQILYYQILWTLEEVWFSGHLVLVNYQQKSFFNSYSNCLFIGTLVEVGFSWLSIKMVTENYEFEYWNIRGHSQRAAIIYLYSSKLSLFQSPYPAIATPRSSCNIFHSNLELRHSLYLLSSNLCKDGLIKSVSQRYFRGSKVCRHMFF